jgi:hypothetical protein
VLHQSQPCLLDLEVDHVVRVLHLEHAPVLHQSHAGQRDDGEREADGYVGAHRCGQISTFRGRNGGEGLERVQQVRCSEAAMGGRARWSDEGGPSVACRLEKAAPFFIKIQITDLTDLKDL